MSAPEAGCYGLSKETVNKIISALQRHKKIQKAILYGSRAKGNYRAASDIDLCLQGERLTYSDLAAINTTLDDLLLPYCIDLSIHHLIENPDLIDHIHRIGLEFYTK